MGKIIIIPDSFKGTMSSRQVGEIIGKAAKQRWPDSEIIRVEVADGGEGSVDAIFSCIKGQKISMRVTGPYWKTVDSFYGMIGETAIIEMAAAAGLPLSNGRRDVGEATTYGVGELMKDALNKGAKKIILGLGGSATNDGGAGAAAACGICFRNANNEKFIPVGNTLGDIQKIELDGLDSRWSNVEIIAMCDVDSPLCGEKGAAVVFGPQKGATQEDVVKLDESLRYFGVLLKESTGKDVLNMKGAGAAGGMAAGIVALFNGVLKSGIDVVLNMIRFETMLDNCSLIITGEGKVDDQSVQGKVISGIAKRASLKGVPVLVVAGTVGSGAEKLYNLGVTEIHGVNPESVSFEKIKKNAESDLQKKVENIFECMQIQI